MLKSQIRQALNMIPLNRSWLFSTYYQLMKVKSSMVRAKFLFQSIILSPVWVMVSITVNLSTCVQVTHDEKC